MSDKPNPLVSPSFPSIDFSEHSQRLYNNSLSYWDPVLLQSFILKIHFSSYDFVGLAPRNPAEDMGET